MLKLSFRFWLEKTQKALQLIACRHANSWGLFADTAGESWNTD